MFDLERRKCAKGVFPRVSRAYVIGPAPFLERPIISSYIYIYTTHLCAASVERRASSDIVSMPTGSVSQSNGHLVEFLQAVNSGGTRTNQIASAAPFGGERCDRLLTGYSSSAEFIER